MDWKGFKETKKAVRCTAKKEEFFSACANHGIYNFMSERAKMRDFFICRLCYKDQFSEGRYELMSVDEWQARENGLFGSQGLGVIDYDNL